MSKLLKTTEIILRTHSKVAAMYIEEEIYHNAQNHTKENIGKLRMDTHIFML